MKLPSSKENVDQGIYFYQESDETLKLLKINSSDSIFFRLNGRWINYEEIEKFWLNPSEFLVAPALRASAIKCFDDHEKAGSTIPDYELKKFLTLY